MAKVTKSAVAPAEATATATPATPTTPKKVFGKEPNGADVFVRVMVDGKGSPLVKKNAKGESVPLGTPQVKVIANLLEAAPNNRLTRKELVAQLPAAGLVTRQPVGRIVSYYQKDLVEYGIVTIKKAAPAPAAATPAA